MKQVILNIPENKFSFFMKLMKSLDFVKIIEPGQTLEDKLTQAQKETWENIKQGFVELEMIEKGTLKSRPIEELLNEL